MSRQMILPASPWLYLAVVHFAVMALVSNAAAHEIRPAYLQIDQKGASRYAVSWRTPMLSGMRLPIALRFPDSVRNVIAPAERDLPDSIVETRVIETTDGDLAGKRLEFVGLQATITDVLVRVHLLDGSVSTTMVHPSQPWVEIAARPARLDVAKTFIVHGIEHILGGYDHLLFVLALVLIVRDRKRLIATITAFTVAHSITLALATLGVIHVAGPPVEAMIAMSILLLATEIVRTQRCGESHTARWPWLVAFAFGLLHGLGFAGALTQIGLPAGDIPLALLTFNIGVELGQLLFVGVILTLFALARRIRAFETSASRMRLVASYAIGGLAAFWMAERIAQFGM